MDSQTRVFERVPPIMPSYLRALSRRGALRTPDGAIAPIPYVEALLPDVALDRDRLAAYARVCGFPAGSLVPPTYSHILAFPAAMALMTDSSFPVPAMGLVHLSNRIRIVRPIEAAERLGIRVHPTDMRSHPSGSAFDMVAQVRVADQLIWESTSTYLYRQRSAVGRAPRPEPVLAADLTEVDTWRLPADAGRRYAAVSGDRNPIHMYSLTARMFGFRRPIAHGMWTKARVLAALGSRLPSSFEVEVSFTAPVLLPSSVRLLAATDGGRFALASADASRIYLSGTVSALPSPSGSM